MRVHDIARATIIVVLGILMIIMAFIMLDRIPYMEGGSSALFQMGSLVSFVAGALVISKGLPF